MEAVYLKLENQLIVCDALRDSVPFLQFKKREKHPWRSVTFNFMKLSKWYQNITYVFISTY